METTTPAADRLARKVKAARSIGTWGIEMTTQEADALIAENQRLAARDRLAAVLLDLDRCMHGRHHGDTCADCRGGRSLGNFHMQPGHVVGYDRFGESIVVPERKFIHAADAWRTGASNAVAEIQAITSEIVNAAEAPKACGAHSKPGIGGVLGPCVKPTGHDGWHLTDWDAHWAPEGEPKP